MTIFERSSMRNTQSALGYQTLGEAQLADSSYGGVCYTATNFKGIHANADGIVEIIGVDDNAVAFNVKVGCTYPYGGTGVGLIGTTLVGDDLIFLF